MPNTPEMRGWGAPPVVMGVLNATPDSFSCDGVVDALALAVRGREFASAGAAIIDVGGESTRPGSEPVSIEEELARVLPVIRALAGTVEARISIDTMKAAVAEAAVGRGATIVNDVSGLRDEGLATVAARHRVSLVLTHNGHTTRERGIAESGDPV
jgi:dihydropteroate synthase